MSNNNIKNEISKNEAIDQYYRLQRRKNNLVNNYSYNSFMSDQLANLDNIVNPNSNSVILPVSNEITRKKIEENIKNLSSEKMGTIENIDNNLQIYRQWVKNNNILKKNLLNNSNIYDKDFIKNIDNLDKTDKKIMNIDRLIQENEFASNQKDQDIFVLKSYFSALIIIIVIGLFYMTGIISPSKFLYVIIIIFFLTTGFVLYKIYHTNAQNV